MQSKLDDVVHFSFTLSMKIILIVSCSGFCNYHKLQLHGHERLYKWVGLDISHIVITKI
jgi:hypothetical protein